MARILSPSDSGRIRDAIARAEARTAAELVVIETRASDAYAPQRAGLALVLLLGASLALYHGVPPLPVDLLLLLQLPLGVLGWWLAGRPPLLRALVTAREADARVDARARRIFAEHGLTDTRDRSAVLILISALEHRVAILADRGVDAVVDTGEWRQDVDAIVAGIRAGHAADGIVEVVDRLAAQLAGALPPRPDDRNELRDAVRQVDD